MAGVFDCGFARVAVKQSFIKASGKPEMDKAKRLESYLAFFGGQHEQNFEIDQKKFNARSITLVKSFNKWYKKDEKQIHWPLLKQSLVQHLVNAEGHAYCK